MKWFSMTNNPDINRLLQGLDNEALDLCNPSYRAVSTEKLVKQRCAAYADLSRYFKLQNRVTDA